MRSKRDGRGLVTSDSVRRGLFNFKLWVGDGFTGVCSSQCLLDKAKSRLDWTLILAYGVSI